MASSPWPSSGPALRGGIKRWRMRLWPPACRAPCLCSSPAADDGRLVQLLQQAAAAPGQTQDMVASPAGHHGSRPFSAEQGGVRSALIEAWRRARTRPGPGRKGWSVWLDQLRRICCPASVRAGDQAP